MCPHLLIPFLTGVQPPLWSPVLGCNSVTLPFRVCFACLQEQWFLCSNQQSIMKHCLLQYQTCEVSAELIGRENILPSSSGRAWSQKNGNGNGVGLDGKGRQIIWIRLEEKSAVNWKASAGGWNEDTVFWLVPLSMMEKQIRAKETWSLDKTLPLTNLDSVYSFAKL